MDMIGYRLSVKVKIYDFKIIKNQVVWMWKEEIK